MTTFEALSLVAQFSLALIATLTLIVSLVVSLNKKEVTAHDQWSAFTSFARNNNLVSRSLCGL